MLVRILAASRERRFCAHVGWACALGVLLASPRLFAQTPAVQDDIETVQQLTDDVMLWGDWSTYALAPAIEAARGGVVTRRDATTPTVYTDPVQPMSPQATRLNAADELARTSDELAALHSESQRGKATGASDVLARSYLTDRSGKDRARGHVAMRTLPAKRVPEESRNRID